MNKHAFIDGYLIKEALPEGYFHYLHPDDVENVKKHGIQGLGYQLEHGDKDLKKKRSKTLKRYSRFLRKGTKVTDKNIIKAVNRFREHPSGINYIYLLQELVDFKKANPELKDWMGNYIPVEVDVDQLQRDKRLIKHRHLDAQPIDYSKLDKKIIFKDIPHPAVLTDTGVIEPKYLKFE
jgi:hypothetical protein